MGSANEQLQSRWQIPENLIPLLERRLIYLKESASLATFIAWKDGIETAQNLYKDTHNWKLVIDELHDIPLFAKPERQLEMVDWTLKDTQKYYEEQARCRQWLLLHLALLS